MTLTPLTGALIASLPLFIGMFLGGAQAATLVDTGQPASSCCTFGYSSSYFTEGTQFITASPVTVTSVQSYFKTPQIYTGAFFESSDITVHGGIASNDTSGTSDVPGTILDQSSFNILQGSTGDWAGPSGVSWMLDPGTYWAIFWVDPNDCDTCRASGYSNPSNPLPSATGLSNGGMPGSWAPYTQDFGLRVEISEVPLPATAWLFGSGLLGLLGTARNKLV